MGLSPRATAPARPAAQLFNVPLDGFHAANPGALASAAPNAELDVDPILGERVDP